MLKADPAAVLKEIDADPAATAEDLYHAVLGDDAPEEYKLKLERRRLEMEREALTREKQERDSASNGQQLEQYQQTIVESVRSLDVDAYPVVAKVIEAYGDAAVQQKLWSYAVQAAQLPENPFVATPEQLLQALTEEYRPLVGAADSAPKEPAPIAKPGAKQTKSLRNNIQRSRAPSKPVEEMTDTEYDEYLRFRARKAAQAVADRDSASEF
jgi:hypothetical protein